MSPTLSDIAGEVGVSIMTVSRALADKPGVAVDTKQRIMDAAKRMGYIVAQGNRIVSRIAPTVGLLVNNIGTEYISEITDGISSILDMAGYDIVIYNPYRLRRTPDDYIFEVSQRPMDGMLIAAANILQSIDYLEQVSQQRYPIVFIDQKVPSSSIPFITTSNWQGAFDAMRYLVQLGHRRVGFIAGPLTESPSSERLAGYRDALTQNGIAYDEQLVRYGDFTRQTGYMCAQALLTLQEPPTAIFASNDPMAYGAMKAIQQKGKRIPEDISLLGYDDIGSSADMHPPLTTVRQPLREMGRMGAQILLDMIKGNAHVDSVELKTSLILRDSCAPMR